MTRFRGYFVRGQSYNSSTMHKAQNTMRQISEGEATTPIPPQTMNYKDALVLLVAAFWSTLAYLVLDPAMSGTVKVVSVLVYLLYESYIVFDHVPVFFTNCVFTTARVNYQNIRFSCFWSCEAMAGWFAYFVLSAHPFVLSNTPNHFYFIFCEFNGIVTSEYFNFGRKGMWLNYAVLMDVAAHVAGAHAGLGWLLDGATSAYTIVWLAVICVGTSWFHSQYMRLAHLLVYIVGDEHATSYRKTAIYHWLFSN